MHGRWITTLTDTAIIATATIALIALLELCSFFIVKFSPRTEPTLGTEGNMQPPGDEQEIFFRELKAFDEQYYYKAFVGWKHPEYRGNHINIDRKGNRVTGFETRDPSSRTIHFFGGSTMWGWGVYDEASIPSLAGKEQTIYNTVNWAEEAYNSRQSLNALINNINRIKKDDVVLFYDGVNDVLGNCQAGNSPDGHSLEGYLRDLITKGKTGPSLSEFAISLFKRSNIFALIHQTLKPEIPPTKGLSEHTFLCENVNIADAVSDFIVNNWKVADTITSTRGARFVCALQPNPYTLDTPPHLESAPLRANIKTVYPLIQKKAKSLSCFVDMSPMLGSDFYFDDCCHITRAGNKRVTELIVQHINSLSR